MSSAILDIDVNLEPSENLVRIFSQSATNESIVIAHGYGIRVSVWHGQLEITDGVGRYRRTRKIPRSDRELQRVVITGFEGYITLAAIRWCYEHDVSISMLNRDGDLVAAHVPESGTVLSLLRSQALSGPGGQQEAKGIEIARFLLTEKLTGQSGNLIKNLGQHRASSRIDHYAGMINDAVTFPELNELERWTANTYFSAWASSGVSVPWQTGDIEVIPASWLSFERRKTGNANTSKRHATDPVNALLNYAYAIGYAEARIACIANRLNPALGFMHADNDKRDSLALDILEAIRPDIDSYVLGILGYGADPRVFSRKDFIESRVRPHGAVRLVAPLTHEVVQQSLTWQTRLGTVARTVAGILGAPSGKQGQRSHNLASQKAEFISRAVDLESIISDETWQRLQTILPPDKKQANGGPPISNRNVIAAIVYLERNHKPWAHVPPGFGVARRTMSSRRQEWKRLGCWDEIWTFIVDLANA